MARYTIIAPLWTCLMSGTASASEPPPQPKLPRVTCPAASHPTYRQADGRTTYGCEDADGARVGPYRVLHPNGELKVTGSYVQNLKNGRWIYFFKNGSPRAAGSFHDGQAEGVWTWWHANGVIAEMGAMRDDMRQGWWNFWRQDGRLSANVFYQDDEELRSVEPQSRTVHAPYRAFEPCWGWPCAWSRWHTPTHARPPYNYGTRQPRRHRTTTPPPRTKSRRRRGGSSKLLPPLLPLP